VFSSDKSRAVSALLVAALLYGATFVVIKTAVEDYPPIAFVAWRFFLGAVALALFAFPRGKKIWLHGSIVGLILFTGYALQTSGLVLTGAANSALITGLYVVITPLLSAVFAAKAPGWWIIGAASLSFVGLVLLTGTNDLDFQRGDLLTLGCAFVFACYILAVSRFAPHHPVVPFTTVQLAVAATLAFPFSYALESPGLPPQSVWGALALTAFGVSVGAFILQIWSQTIVGPNTTAVVLAAEPAFGLATAWVVLGERLTPAAWGGALLILGAIYIVITKQTDPAWIEAESVTPTH